MSMSGLTIYFDQAEAGVRAFIAGADILEKPADTDAMINGLVTAVKRGRITEDRLNQSVRKILAWKFELGLIKQKFTPVDQIDRIVSGRESEALATEIATKAITLVRNDENAIPLDRTKRIAVLGLSNSFEGDSMMSSLDRTLRQNGVRFDSVLLQDNSSPEQIARARDITAKADIVVAAMYGRVRSGAKNSVGVPDSGAAILKDLLGSNKKVVGISFGNPYVLTSFSQLKTYLVAYGDMSELQVASVKAVLGSQDITGRLPISLPGLYPRGTGIQLTKK
jgi:beta-N-acetylhexosaminidase